MQKKEPSSEMEEYLQANREEPACTRDKHSVYCERDALVARSPSGSFHSPPPSRREAKVTFATKSPLRSTSLAMFDTILPWGEAEVSLHTKNSTNYVLS